MALLSHRATARALLATFVAGAALPAGAADRVTLPVRIADPAVTSVCALSVDPATRVAYPAVGLTGVFPGIVTVSFVIYDASAHALGTHDVAVAPLDAQGRPPQLTPFYTERGSASASCEIRSHEEPGTRSGGSSLGVIAGVVVVGAAIAVAAGHGGSKSSVPAVKPTSAAAATLAVQPAALTFDRAGGSAASAVTGDSLAAPFTLSMPDCGRVADVVRSGASLLVTAKGPGTCTVTLASGGRSALLSIVVRSGPAAASSAPAPHSR